MVNYLGSTILDDLLGDYYFLIDSLYDWFANLTSFIPLLFIYIPTLLRVSSK